MERPGHVLIVGATTTASRLVEELERAGTQAVVVAGSRTEPGVVDRMRQLGAEVTVESRIDDAALDRAGLARAGAAVIFGSDDVEMIRIALTVEERRPDIALIIELGNPHLGSRLPALLGDVTVMSSAELAAPALVSAALADDQVSTISLAGRDLVVGPPERVGGERLAVLAGPLDATDPGDEPLLPDAESAVVLGTRVVGEARRPVRRSGLLGVITHVFDRRARAVVLGLIMLIIASVVYFRLLGLDWLQALLYALTTSTTTGGPADIDGLAVGWRIGAVVIALSGLVLSSGVTAVIIDALISSRLATLTGGVRGRPRHHVIVVGLGRVGMAVVSRLVAREVPVVAIEQREDALGVQRARRLRVPVIIAEGSDVTALEAAGLERAEAIMAVTDDDAANLEIGLAAAQVSPRARVVTRLFDDDLADRVERRLGLGVTRSVSMLAAPAFAAAATGRHDEAVHPVGRQVLLFTTVVVGDTSPALGRAPGSCAEPGRVRVLAHAPAGGSWSWPPSEDRGLAAGDRLAVAATRRGLAGLLRTVR